MVKAIANKLVEISNDEYQYYLELEKVFGKDSCLGLFKSDKEGKITSVLPATNNPTASILIFFFLNLMLNQRLRSIDSGVERLKMMEEKIDELSRKMEAMENRNHEPI